MDDPRVSRDAKDRPHGRSARQSRSEGPSERISHSAVEAGPRPGECQKRSSLVPVPVTLVLVSSETRWGTAGEGGQAAGEGEQAAGDDALKRSDSEGPAVTYLEGGL